jgi:hypothetical protein
MALTFSGDNVTPSYLRPRYAQIYTFYLTTLSASSVAALTIDDIPVSVRSVLRAGPLLPADYSWAFVSLLTTVGHFNSKCRCGNVWHIFLQAVGIVL